MMPLGWLLKGTKHYYNKAKRNVHSCSANLELLKQAAVLRNC